MSNLDSTPKRIGLASDHGGHDLKLRLAAKLREAGFEPIDFGNLQPAPEDDYPDWVVPMARAVARGEVDRGVAVCGSGVGACVAANKVRGVRACLITDPFSARQGVEDDDLNVICLGGLVVGPALAWDLVGTFLAARFSGAERHCRRLAKVAELEADASGDGRPAQGDSMDKARRKATLEHYGREDMTERVARALAEAGLDQGSADGAELALLDQFHVRGLAATREMAEGLDLPEGSAVLDVGCGLGGPARYLAQRGGWQVTGVDLSPRFIELARLLAERSGCSERVTFIQADALDLPFGDATFDGVWTQHVAMNIRDRAGFYRGLRRVLKPGGRLAVYDVVAGAGPLVFPVPWALTGQTSFLLKAEDMRESLREAGFAEISWADRTAEGIAWFAQQRTAAPARPGPPLGLHLVMGPGFKAMAANLARNLKEGRAGLVQAILRREDAGDA